MAAFRAGRTRALYGRIAELLTERLDDIANAWTLQVGAPIMLTKKLVGQNPTLFDYYADLIERYPFVDDRKRDDGGKVKVVKEPVGVCAAITPWNAPLVLLSYKVAAGLAAGCTFVSKPSPETPLEAYILAECIEKAGLPRRVQCRPGRSGRRRLSCPSQGRRQGGLHRFDRRRQTYRRRLRQRLARVSLELGGKSPAILLDDADFPQPAEPDDLIMPITGQVCFSLTRILVPEPASRNSSIFSSARSPISRSETLPTTVQMGPLAMGRQLARVKGYIDAGIKGGATIACGGGRPKGLEKGYYVEPTYSRMCLQT